MLEELQSISIVGRCFENESILKIFQNSSDRVCLIYGRNGSGKSTISKGIKLAIDEDKNRDINIKFLDKSLKEISLEYIKNNTHVFNEDYIDKNVRIDSDALGAIVLIGPQVAYQTDIDKYENLRKQAKDELIKLEEELNKYNNSKDVNSPEYYIANIKKILKQSGGWADTVCVIKGMKKNPTVNEDSIKNIYQNSPKETLEELSTSFKLTLELLNKISDTSISYEPIPEIEDFTEQYEKSIISLLSKKIEKSVLTEREELILSEIKKGRQKDIENVRECFLNPNLSYCPYCYQELTDSYKDDLIKSIEKIFNKDVDEHKMELSNLKFPILNLNFDEYDSLDSKVTKQIKIKLKKCQDIEKKYQEAIQQKQSNVYSPCIIENLELSQAINDLRKDIEALKKCKSDFDNAIKKGSQIKENLLLLNNEIAYYSIKSDYENYLLQSSKKSKIEQKKKEKEEIYNNLDKEIKKLQAKKSDIYIAIDHINNALEYILFSKDRLSIEIKDNKYYLKSKGKTVIPKNVSQGERNIIALCYFFTQIMENQEAEKLFQSEQFIIVDDPISSFDFENKIGILSYLRFQLSQIVKGNDKSKIMILTHDLSTMFNLMTTLEDLAEAVRKDNRVSNISFSKLELQGGKIIDFIRKHNEYDRLLNNVYDYAENGTLKNELAIGNIMRRVLEAFSTFVYNKGIGGITNDCEILKAMGDKSTYFSNLMYRLVLHGESHYENQIHSMKDNLGFFDYISDTEKQRTAKDLLCMLYQLNPYHIENYIKEKKKIDQIIKWLKAIKNESDFKLESKISRTIKSIKLFDYALSAGQGIDLMDIQVPYEEIEVENSLADFAIKISGDSMEPKIHDGNIVLIKQTDVIDNGKIGAFYYDGAVYCKVLKKSETGAVLESLNKEYAPINLNEDLGFKIYGEVIEVLDNKSYK